MSLNSFELRNPTTLKDAVAMLDAKDNNRRRIRLMAGGQDLLTEMKERLVEPEIVVNLKHIPGMNKIEHNPKTGLKIGALVTLTEIAEHPIIRTQFDALAMAAESVASPQIRNVGTIGGNLCQRPRCWYYRNEETLCLKKGGTQCFAISGENKYNAILGGGPSFIVHPSDTATALVALNASVTLSSPSGTRVVALEKFFVLPEKDVRNENILKPNEVLTHITIPASPITNRSVYLKFRERQSMDWAVSGVAVAIQATGGKVTQARIVLGAVAPIPWRVPKAEAALIGKTATPQTLQAVADAALAGALALYKNGYKIPLTKTLVKRAIQQALA